MKKTNLLLIAGQQQNVGKTTLACNIISRFSREHTLIALKVTPHFHKDTGMAESLVEGEGFSIMEETNTDTQKDTSLMLKSGAEMAYLVQTEPESLKDALSAVFQMVPQGSLMVCESAGVRDYVEPGVFLALRQLYCKICSIDDDKMFKQADRVVTFTVNGFDFGMDELEIKDNKWKLTNIKM